METHESNELAQFAEVWGQELSHDLASKLTCDEVDALASLLRSGGHDALADDWINGHALTDDSDDAHFRPQQRSHVP